MKGFAVALRIARRDAMRAKGRTALVLCMIGLPVMTIVAMVVLLKTAAWSDRESMPYVLGHADARVMGHAHAPITQSSPTDYGATVTDGGEEPPQPGAPWNAQQVANAFTAKLGPGTRVIPINENGSLSIRTDRGRFGMAATQLDLRDPLAGTILTITRGRAPANGNEIALAPRLRHRGIDIGSVVEIDERGTTKRVSGFVEDPRAPRTPRALVLPGALPAADVVSPDEWLVKTPRAVSWQDVLAFNKTGLGVLSRHVVNHPPAVPDDLPPDSPFTVANAGGAAVVAMAVAMIVMEVVLLAGPAFAVGVKRQRRQLALLAAGGGSPNHLKAVVLAGGLVIGGTASVVGAFGGLLAAAFVKPAVRSIWGTVWGPYEVPWGLVAAPMVLGLVSGVLAAYAPALQAARMNVVAALTGRRDQARSRKGWPIAGGLLMVAGVLLCLIGARVWREIGAAFGAAAIILGCVMIGPWAVGMAARTARWLPLPLRLAVRDGARNRGRAAPAVAAIMAAVAGLTALAIGSASDFAQRRVEYVPRLPMGSAMVTPPIGRAEAYRAAVERALPGVPTVPLRALPGQNTLCQGNDPCPFLQLGSDPGSGETFADNLVGGAREARLLLGRDDPAVTAALAAGRIVLFNHRKPATTTITGWVKTWGDNGKDRTLRSVEGLPALQTSTLASVGAIVPPQVAGRFRLPIATEAFGIDRADHRVTRREEHRLLTAIGLHDPTPNQIVPNVYVERGFSESFAVELLILAVASAVLVVGGSLIATGLAAADALPDLATLGAVGARPRTRRLLMMGQAGFVAVLGCWLGILVGFVPGIAVARPLTADYEGNLDPLLAPHHGVVLDIPWQLIGAIGIAVPLVAMVGAGLFTRSRLPAVRRMAA